MIETKEIACPECENYGLIALTDSNSLVCGKCGLEYSEDEALNLKEGEASE